MKKYFLSTAVRLLSAISRSCECYIWTPETFVALAKTERNRKLIAGRGRSFCPG